VSDVIEIRGLRVTAVHGMLAEERLRAQPFELDIDVEVDGGQAAESDDLADTVDYGELIRVAVGVVSGPPHDLLESLAAAVASALLAVEGTAGTTVTVRKLRPPLPFDVDTVGVRVARRAPGR
jgi:dihydroneopterin aldolase